VLLVPEAFNVDVAVTAALAVTVPLNVEAALNVSVPENVLLLLNVPVPVAVGLLHVPLVIVGAVSVLFVSVSVVAAPTIVSITPLLQNFQRVAEESAHKMY
jgi:hypothetical protein